MSVNLQGTFPCALNVKCSGCQSHVVLSYIEDENVRTVVLGSVVVESSWEGDVAELLPGWQLCVPSVKGPEVLVVDEVHEISAGLASAIVQGSLAVVKPVGVICLHNPIRGGELKKILKSRNVRCAGLSPVEDGVLAHCQNDGKAPWIECGKFQFVIW